MATANDQKVMHSQVLWGDVCQAVDPDPQQPYPIYTFGGRKEFVEPYRSPVPPASESSDLVEEGGVNFIVTQTNVRVGL